MSELKRVFEIESEEQTMRFARAFAKQCRGGLLVGLSGTLGAGKTFFVREVACELGADRAVVLSPTFTLCNEYSTNPKIFHIDLYRIRDEDEFYELGIDEMCESDAIVFIEWADRFADSLPPEKLMLHIELVGDSARRFELSTEAANSTNSTARQVLESIDW